MRYRQELCIEARSLVNRDRRSMSDPFCVVSVKEPQERDFTEFGRTETVWEDLNPRFVTKFLVDFVPPDSRMRVEFYDRDSESEMLSKHDYLGETVFVLKELLENRMKVTELNIKRRDSEVLCGLAHLGVDRVILPRRERMITFEIKFGKVARALSSMKKCFLEFHREMDNGAWTPVLRTEATRVDTGVCFDLFSVEECMLNGGDPVKLTRINIYKVYRVSQQTKLVAFTKFSLNQMLTVQKGFSSNFIRDEQLQKAAMTVVSYVTNSDDFSIRLDYF